ncbi:hypothetical protein ABIC45_003530 [Mucilaginibacter rubeus]|nr:hypothetical protein GCM10011500_53880 [Mucilaginibacter rubeus]
MDFKIHFPGARVLTSAFLLNIIGLGDTSTDERNSIHKYRMMRTYNIITEKFYTFIYNEGTIN